MLVAFKQRYAKPQTSFAGSILNNIFNESVDVSICHSLKMYWVSNPHASLSDIVFEAQSLQAIQKESAKTAHARNQNATAKRFCERTWHNSTANVVNKWPITSSSQLSFCSSRFSPGMFTTSSTFPFTGTDILCRPRRYHLSPGQHVISVVHTRILHWDARCCHDKRCPILPL